MKRLLTYAFMTLSLSSCGGLNFADNADFKSAHGFLGFDESGDTVVHNQLDSDIAKHGKIKPIGTLTIADFTKAEADRNPTVFEITRQRSKFMAKTSLYESDNKDKTFFDQTFLNVGIDKKNKGLDMELTLKF